MIRGPAPGRGGTRRKVVSVINMRAAWGADAPDWVVVLAEACDDHSQSTVARRIGYSTSVVNQVVNGGYDGDMARVEEAVRASLMAETVDCPEVGISIPLATCLEHQKHAKAGNRSSAFRARMAAACHACPHSRIGGGHDR